MKPDWQDESDLLRIGESVKTLRQENRALRATVQRVRDVIDSADRGACETVFIWRIQDALDGAE